jgi:hypothetical protein
MELISSHKPLVKSKHDIAHMGIATAFTKISFPAFNKSLSFQPWIQAQIFCFMYSKALFLDLPTETGSQDISHLLPPVISGFDPTLTGFRKNRWIS